jgi:aspartyl protease family protein
LTGRAPPGKRPRLRESIHSIFASLLDASRAGARQQAPGGGAMFGRVIVVVILGVAAALLGSFSLLQRLPAPAPVAAAPAPVAAAPTPVAATPTPAAAVADPSSPAPTERQSSGYREASLQADGRGQYAAGVLINGVPVRMLVDTGASEVCVSASTAARLGLRPSGGRRYTIKTANGLSTASPTILRSLSLDGLYMNDVEALILTPEAGEVNLLGASFLKRLVSVEQRGGMLILRQ